MKVTTKSLEQRLTQSQTKVEELNHVKGENETLKKKFNSLSKNLEEARKEIESQKKQSEDMNKKFEEVSKKAAEGADALEKQGQEGGSYKDTLAMFRQNRGHNQQSRQSRTQHYFHEMAKTSWLGGRKIDSSMTPMASRSSATGNSAELQKMLYAQEENYQGIIYQLQLDRMKMKGAQVTEKLNKLVKSDSALNQFTKMHSDKQNMVMRISRKDQNQLESAIENVDKLKTSVKLQMAGIKIVDLKKKHESIRQSSANS